MVIPMKLTWLLECSACRGELSLAHASLVSLAHALFVSLAHASFGTDTS